jgi:hypothetical protein
MSGHRLSETHTTTGEPKMTDKPTMLITEIDGVEVMSCDALSLLFGVSAADITAHMKSHVMHDMTAFPADWLKAGKRRVKEASAATGTNSLLEILEFWAARDLDAIIVPINDDGEVEL